MIVRRTAIASILAAGALVIAGCGMMNKVQGVMTVPLSGQNEVPPNLSGGSGTGKVELDGNVIKWNVTYSGTTGPVTAGHFHGPAQPGAAPSGGAQPVPGRHSTDQSSGARVATAPGSAGRPATAVAGNSNSTNGNSSSAGSNTATRPYTDQVPPEEHYDEPGDHHYDPYGGDPGYDPRQESTPSIMELPTDQATRLERDALMAMLQHPAAVGREMMARATRVTFSNATLSVVRDAIATSLDALDSGDWVGTIVREVPAPFATIVQQLAIAPIPQRAEQLDAYCVGITTSIVDRDLLRAKADLLGSLQRTDAAAEPERYARIQRDLMNVERERRVLRNE